jgi:hypothetical protein
MPARQTPNCLRGSIAAMLVSQLLLPLLVLTAPSLTTAAVTNVTFSGEHPSTAVQQLRLRSAPNTSIAAKHTCLPA